MHEDLRACYWFEGLPGDPPVRPCLQEALEADVAIIGAGYTGLWAAYHLKRLDPDLSVVILEAEHAGFGASGRNGGWLMGAIEGLDKYLAPFDEETRVTGHRVVHGIPGSAGKVIQDEGIDCDFAHGGAIYAAARYPEQLARARAHLDELRSAGHGEADYRWLDAGELQTQVRISGAQGAVYTPNVAAIQPAKLAAGLAAAVERLGVRLFERSRVTQTRPGELHTASGRVRSPVIISAMEGYGSDVMSMRRHILPFQSGMVATEPLSPATWSEIGFASRPVLADYSRWSTYMQRTADNRLVFINNDARYFYDLERDYSHHPKDYRSHFKLLVKLFPFLKGIKMTHHWGGRIGMTLNFLPSIGRIGKHKNVFYSMGYNGHGVAFSQLAGKMLAELLAGDQSELTNHMLINKRIFGIPSALMSYLAINGYKFTYKIDDWLLSIGK